MGLFNIYLDILKVEVKKIAKIHPEVLGCVLDLCVGQLKCHWKWFLRKRGSSSSLLGFLLFCSTTVCQWVVSVSCCVLLLSVPETKRNSEWERDAGKQWLDWWVMLLNIVSCVTSLVWGAAVCYCATLIWQTIWVVLNWHTQPRSVSTQLQFRW